MLLFRDEQQLPAEPTLDYLAMKRNPSATSKANLAREPRTDPLALEPGLGPLNSQQVGYSLSDLVLVTLVVVTRPRIEEDKGMDFVARVGLGLACTEEHSDRSVPVRVRGLRCRPLATLPVRCSSLFLLKLGVQMPEQPRPLCAATACASRCWPQGRRLLEKSWRQPALNFGADLAIATTIAAAVVRLTGQAAATRLRADDRTLSMLRHLCGT